jgi:hypothetical protein
MWPVPTVDKLALFSGRPVSSYTGYAQSALIQATILFTILSENDTADYNSLVSSAPNDVFLAEQGILAYSDWIYLRQPYQAAIASPMLSETIGSYTYSKPPPLQVRNVQAQELGAGVTGVVLWDTAIQYLSKRRRSNGVAFGQIRAFDTNRDAEYDNVMVRYDTRTGDYCLLGPADMNRENVPGFGGSISGESFPGDPGVS